MVLTRTLSLGLPLYSLYTEPCSPKRFLLSGKEWFELKEVHVYVILLEIPALFAKILINQSETSIRK